MFSLIILTRRPAAYLWGEAPAIFPTPHLPDREKRLQFCRETARGTVDQSDGRDQGHEQKVKAKELGQLPLESVPEA